MFTIKKRDGKARAGLLKTRHGTIRTPFFMPIATKGAAKPLSPQELVDAGTECLISNAFLFYLRPGLEVIKKHGDIHTFMQWKKALFTDSGGFQILDSTFLKKRTDEGVHFRNPFNNTLEFLRPEDIIKIEEELGADVVMTLDDVPHYGKTFKEHEEAMKRTHLWAQRCKEAHTKKNEQLLFGICQGGTFEDLRKESARFINSLDFDGVALGGLGIGEGSSLMEEMVKISVAEIDERKVRYLMGVGSPRDLVISIGLGVDCFDSRFPTLNGRHGSLFTKEGTINITNAQFKEDSNSLDCSCPVCLQFSKSYLHHIFKTHEPIADRYGCLHNIYFIQDLMKKCREAILEGRFEIFKEEFLKEYRK